MSTEREQLPRIGSGLGPRAITLRQLADELSELRPKLYGDEQTQLCGLSQDSRRIQPGELFVARVGERQSGLDFVSLAQQNGASSILTDAPGELSLPLPTLQVSHARLAMGRAAELLFDSPSQRLPVVGITGTNGKTTTAWLCQRALELAGLRCARLGTLGYDFGEHSVDSPLTTPEADTISRYLARAAGEGAGAFVMEVSSHALEQRRADAIHFRVAVFTNLTQDHLDYHPSLEAYAEAKARLFLELEPAVCVIHVGDAFGAKLAARASALGRRVIRVGAAQERCAGEAAPDVSAAAVEIGAFGLRAQLWVLGQEFSLRSRLVGEHNLENLLCCAGIAQALIETGVALDLRRVVQAFSQVPSAPGRLERCDAAEDELTVLVDYAHTPDALERSLTAARGLLGAGAALWCVFGCGGDRDPGKRPKMGDAVGRLADRAVVTNDNPRSEAPQAIADMILPGLAAYAIEVTVILDRSQAIRLAIAQAKPGDLVLIAGKGHEPYQLIGDQVLAFDDRVVARDALAARRQAQGGAGAASKGLG